MYYTNLSTGEVIVNKTDNTEFAAVDDRYLPIFYPEWFSKPEGMTYGLIDVWIDENKYKEDCDEDKLFHYLCILCCMMVSVKKLNRSARDAREFAVYFATDLFCFMRRAKHDPDVEPIQYIRNYVDSICKYRYQDYIYEKHKLSNYKTKKDKHLVVSANDVTKWHSSIEDMVDDTSDLALNALQVSIYFDLIGSTIESFLKTKVFAKNKLELYRLTMSVKLTVLNSLTNYKTFNDNKNNTSELMFNAEIIPIHIVLYHLPPSYNPLILVLAREIKESIKNDAKYLLYDYSRSAVISSTNRVSKYNSYLGL